MRILLGTNNKGKRIEMTEALGDLGLNFLSPLELNITGDPEETGANFAENAELKARYFFTESGLPTIADDSGIIIDALKGELGVHTRRWGAGPEASDEEWIAYFLDRMNREKNKSARFVCHIAYIDPEGSLTMFEGICNGSITETLEANYLPGLPLSACFKPNSCSAVFSALSLDQKNSTSHRGRALTQLRTYLIEAS